ncbi:MAG: flagellar export protein FliJ [candidate division Zixibacteria bacterium]|nr:flagellar export protein FliJ [candidate division Zixibacteria bacterium]
MKKFNFRLEKIRKYKEQLEQNKKLKLASEQARHLVEQNKLSDIIYTKGKYYLMYGIRKPGKINIYNLLVAKRYIDKLSQDIVVQTEVVTSVEKNVSKAQQELLNASREKKKYEKLKEKHLQNFNKDMLRLETRELDEFGSRDNRTKQLI